MPQAGQILNPSDVPFIVRRGHRETIYPSASTFITAESLVYRIDNIPVRAGKFYSISTGMLNVIASVVGDVGHVRLRYNELVPVTVANGSLLHTWRQYQNNVSQSNLGSISTLYTPTQDLTTLSIGLTVARAVAGTSSTGVRLWGSAAEPIDLWIKMEGDDPGVSGTSL